MTRRQTFMITEEREDAWEDYKKVHPDGVKLVCGKPFPWLERWGNIFGNDRASGQNHIDVGSPINNLYNGNNTQAGGNVNQGSNMNSAPETEFIDADDEATSFTVGDEDYSQVNKKASSK